MDLSRRRVLVGAGTLAASGFVAVGCSRRDSSISAKPAASAATLPTPAGAITLRAARARVTVAGAPLTVWRFEGEAAAGAVELVSGVSYLGPTFRVRRGARVRVRFENHLDEASIVHWHGLDVSEANDGHPRFAIPAGATRDYDFEVTNRPGTYWYHPHPDGRTGLQVYAGLAGMFLVVDDEDAARGLPTGAHDRMLVLQDRRLGADGQLVYDPNPMLGFLGDRVFVNGEPTPTIALPAGSHRLRVLNGSNSRIYKLALSDGRPLVAIGSDGGLLDAPVTRPYVTLSPGERVELWIDFAAGESVWLESLAFDGGAMMGMGGMGMGRPGMGMTGGGPPNGTPLRLCRFEVRGDGPRLPLPRAFEPLAFRPDDEVVNRSAPRRFELSMAMMHGLLNGRSFEMMETAPNERIRLGTTEDWEFVNAGGMMAMPHPLHIHGGQFQVLSRQVADWGRAAVDTVADGRVESGWKDTVLLMPGERVRLRVRFERHAGLFLYHCHNLEHEDGGMMRNFRVEA